MVLMRIFCFWCSVRLAAVFAAILGAVCVRATHLWIRHVTGNPREPWLIICDYGTKNMSANLIIPDFVHSPRRNDPD